MASEAAIEVLDLVREIDGQRVVDGLSLRVEPGEIVGLLGPNGAGKTTTVETIEGYQSPTAGRVSVLGLDPIADRTVLAARWGVMPQAGGLPMGLTVAEAVELFVRLHDSPADPDELLETCGLSELGRRRWRRMSGGEQQRLSLALALAGGPDVLLLDEPTAALDAAGRGRVLDIIRARADAGTAVLITTHRYDDVERVGDRVVVIDDGRLVVSGTVDELTSGQPHIRFDADPGLDTTSLASSLDAPITEARPGHYQIDLDPSPTRVAAVTTWLADRQLVASSIEAGRRSLEEIMLGLDDRPGNDQSSDEQPEGERR